MKLITANFGTAYTGATVLYTVYNEDKSVFQARTATGVTELVASSGIFGVSVNDDIINDRTVVWDIGGAVFACESYNSKLSTRKLVS